MAIFRFCKMAAGFLNFMSFLKVGTVKSAELRHFIEIARTARDFAKWRGQLSWILKILHF